MMKNFLFGACFVAVLCACGDDGSVSQAKMGEEVTSSAEMDSSADVAVDVRETSSFVKIVSSSSLQSSSSERILLSSSQNLNSEWSSSLAGMSSSSLRVASSSSVKLAVESSSAIPVTESSSAVAPLSSSVVESSSAVELSSSQNSSSSSAESSSSIEVRSSSSVESSSSAQSSSATVESCSSSLTESSSSSKDYSSFYKTKCPSGKTCTYTTTEYLNQEMLADGKYDEILDERDYRMYKVVIIGNQTWLAQNLNFEYKVNSSAYGNYCYENNPENCEAHGRLYTYAASIDSVRLYKETGYKYGYDHTAWDTENAQGVCPENFHVPSIDEWKELVTYVGESQKALTELKSVMGWAEGMKGTDNYGFSVAPAGERFVNGQYIAIDNAAIFWSSTANRTSTAIPVSWGSDTKGNPTFKVFDNTSSCDKREGYSVRCVLIRK